MPELNDLNADSPAKLSRRNVVVGTAWAVPAIALVGAAPAMATSSITSVSATYSASTGRVTFTVNVTGWKSGDSVSVSIAPSGIVFSGQSPLGSRPLTGSTMSWTGKINSGQSAKGSYTVTFVVTTNNPSGTFQKTATLVY